MAKQLHGAYDSKHDALQAINELREDDIGISTISLVAHDGKVVKSNFTTQSQDDGFLEGIIESLAGIDYDGDPVAQLQALGFDDADIKKYESYLKEGKSLVFIDKQ